MSGNPPTPTTWVAGSFPQATDLNSQVRDAMNFFTGRPVFRAHDNLGTQTIPGTSTNTRLVLNTVDEDTYSGWTSGASNKYTIQATGIYIVVVTLVATGGSGAGNTQYAAVNYDEGVQFMAGPNYPISGLGPEGVQCIIPLFLRVGETVAPAAWQNSGANITMNAGGIGKSSAFEVLWTSK